MKLFNWFGREHTQEDVRSEGRDHFLVKVPSGEVRIYAELGSRPDRVISSDSIEWCRPNSQILSEEEKKLAVNKLCDFLQRKNRSFEVD